MGGVIQFLIMASGLLDTALLSIERVRNDLPSQALRVLAETQQLIIDLNTKDQLQKGLDNQGNKITPSYRNARYARAKNSRNALPGLGTPDLNLTGSFQKNFYVINRGKEFELFSSDKKASDLNIKYDNIFGLTPDNEDKYNLEILLPRLTQWMLLTLKI